jgi:hypothetical protein
VINPFAFVGDLGSYKVFAPRGFTDTGRIHRFQTRTVSKLAEQMVHFRDDLNASLGQVIEATYTEGEGTLAATTTAKLGRTTRDTSEVVVTTGAAHAVFLTANVPGGAAGAPHDIYAANARSLRFYWKSPPAGVGPAGVYHFKHVLWRPHNIAPGADPIADVLSYYAGVFQRVMLTTHDTALTEFVSGSDGQLVEVA